MRKDYFVDEKSIVRQVWGKSDTILFIFAGAAAEFALNKAVDWLYFTGRLPADPLGRLFSTVNYSKAIVFSETHAAHRTIDAITSMHEAVESGRGKRIPEWAYRDVLFMLIDYSIRSFEVLERKLTDAEKKEVFRVFQRLGDRMGLKELPKTVEEWELVRHSHLMNDLAHSHYTDDLFRQYRKQLGPVRYWILLEAQKLVVPQRVKALLGFKGVRILYPALAIYSVFKALRMDWLLKAIILPAKYRSAIKALDNEQSPSKHQEVEQKWAGKYAVGSN